MQTLSTIITILLWIVSIILIATVLMQKTKSAGMGAAFGGETQSFTAKGRAASKEAKLQKLTVIFGIALGVLAIVLAAIQ